MVVRINTSHIGLVAGSFQGQQGPLFFKEPYNSAFGIGGPFVYQPTYLIRVGTGGLLQQSMRSGKKKWAETLEVSYLSGGAFPYRGVPEQGLTTVLLYLVYYFPFQYLDPYEGVQIPDLCDRIYFLLLFFFTK